MCTKFRGHRKIVHARIVPNAVANFSSNPSLADSTERVTSLPLVACLCWRDFKILRGRIYNKMKNEIVGRSRQQDSKTALGTFGLSSKPQLQSRLIEDIALAATTHSDLNAKSKGFEVIEAFMDLVVGKTLLVTRIDEGGIRFAISYALV